MHKHFVFLLLMTAAGMLMLACTTGGTTACRTAFDTCRTDEPGRVGYPCTCAYEYHVNPGVFVENY